jgi:hypothetical protein
MKNQVNEYKTIPVLSDKARAVMKNHSGGPIDPETKLELENYVRDIQPFLEAGFTKMKERFDRIFK